MFSLASAATDTVFCKAPIYPELAESKITPVAPADTRPRTPLISFCIVQLRTFWRLSVSLQPLIQALGNCPASGAPWSSPCHHPSVGVGYNNRSFTERNALFECSVPSVLKTCFRILSLIVVGNPTPSEGWGHEGRPWSLRSRATPQGLDQRS